MSSDEILTKAIEKAQANGYKKGFLFSVEELEPYIQSVESHQECPFFECCGAPIGVFDIIFDQEFAIAFWGKEIIPEWDVEYRRMKVSDAGKQWHGNLFEYQYHLQQMAIEEDKISYLERFI